MQLSSEGHHAVVGVIFLETHGEIFRETRSIPLAAAGLGVHTLPAVPPKLDVVCMFRQNMDVHVNSCQLAVSSPHC